MPTKPAGDFRYLVYSPIRSALGRFRPMNKMRKYLGKQFTVEELYDSDFHSEADLPKLKLVRAYQVKTLIGATMLINSEKEIANSISELLAARLPDISWQVKPDWTGPFLKYLLINGSIPAPADNLTSEPMYIELYGELVEINHLRLDSEEGRIWFDSRRDEYRMADRRDEPVPGISGEMIILIRSATYANVMHPSVGVPFYS